MTPYEKLIQEVSTETLIQTTAHIQAYTGAMTTRVELWQKIQLCLIESFKIRLGEYKIDQKFEKIPKESLQLLTSALCAQAFGQMRNPQLLEYLIKANHIVVDDLTLLDVVQLFDALYKSQISIPNQVMDPFVQKFQDDVTVKLL